VTVGRYGSLSVKKASGVVYTPTELADFLARQAWQHVAPRTGQEPLRVLDPALGDGALLEAFCRFNHQAHPLQLAGIDLDPVSVQTARENLTRTGWAASPCFVAGDFLAMDPPGPRAAFDVVLVNPPYVRTQALERSQTRELAKRFGLKGRIDLSFAFLLAIADVLRPGGVAAILTSNRLMTTRTGASLRQRFLERFHIHHVWDLGDTKLFDAAVLPCVIVATRHDPDSQPPRAPARFAAIYASQGPEGLPVKSALDALTHVGPVTLPDGETFLVRHGELCVTDDQWRLASPVTERFFETAERHTWRTFEQVGTIRVGVKTTADKVFIRDDWAETCPGGVPELLRPIITHHIARPYRPETPRRQILYPHTLIDGKRRPVDLEAYPRTRAYLEHHKDRLSGRRYIQQSGRAWYELWVPHDPDAWSKPKLVFRDIAPEPTAFIDLTGAVVNGDCYWMTLHDGVDPDVLYLAMAVANSTFAERFYDLRFANKLYGGRRRYITQYLNSFPLPDPNHALSQEAIALARGLHSDDNPDAARRLDALIWHLFGLSPDSE
jgi:adenine-specific DNA-methyltransferase